MSTSTKGLPSEAPEAGDSDAASDHKLIAYGVAVELLAAVKVAKIRDAKLRKHALGSAKSACLNCAEGAGAGRVTRADKARAFAIARGETVEAAERTAKEEAVAAVNTAKDEAIVNSSTCSSGQSEPCHERSSNEVLI